MIINYAACDHCGTQTEINEENKNVFQARIQTIILCRWKFNTNFFSEYWPKESDKSSDRGTKNNINLTFCDKECFIDYIKKTMTDNGTMRLSEDEIIAQEEQKEEVAQNIGSLQGALKGRII
ncbi:hypothetical protein HYV49_05190 [Candidatus Pacearchaeota archaeon]|nr:hypothetical protein [Candidatus Pacearchaeota archaeon]